MRLEIETLEQRYLGKRDTGDFDSFLANVGFSNLVIYYTKNCTTFKFLTFDMRGQSRLVEAEAEFFIPFTKTCRFHRFRFHIPGAKPPSCVVDRWQLDLKSNRSLRCPLTKATWEIKYYYLYSKIKFYA